MSSSYPTSLDSFATNHADNVGEVIEAADVNDLADAVNKIEAELGTDPSGSLATVKARLDALLRPPLQSAVQVPHTGNTAETTLATIQVPANAMGPNGRVRVTVLWSMTSSANNKTIRVRFGGTSGTIYQQQQLTTNQINRLQAEWANRNATNSQVGGPAGASSGWGGSSAAIVTSAVDTTANADIVISGQLANSGETIALEHYLVEIFPGA